MQVYFKHSRCAPKPEPENPCPSFIRSLFMTTFFFILPIDYLFHRLKRLTVLYVCGIDSQAENKTAFGLDPRMDPNSWVLSQSQHTGHHRISVLPPLSLSLARSLPPPSPLHPPPCSCASAGLLFTRSPMTKQTREFCIGSPPPRCVYGPVVHVFWCVFRFQQQEVAGKHIMLLFSFNLWYIFCRLLNGHSSSSSYFISSFFSHFVHRASTSSHLAFIFFFHLVVFVCGA